MSHDQHLKVYDFRLVNASTVTAATLFSALTTGMGKFVQKIVVQGLPTNTGQVAIGATPSVTAGSESGVQLYATQTVTYEHLDLSQISMLPKVAGEGLLLQVFVNQTNLSQTY